VGDDDATFNNDPPGVQPPSVNPQTQSQTANLPNKDQGSAQTTVSVGNNQSPTVGVAATAGLPAFSDKNSAQVQLGVTTSRGTPGTTGESVQLQGSRYWIPDANDPNAQHSLLVSTQLSMNPKLAAGLGLNYEQDWGGDNRQRPAYQRVEQLYVQGDANAQIGSVGGTGTTVGLSALRQWNEGLTNDLNPKYSLGIEVKVQGTRLEQNGVEQFMATAGAFASKNWTLDNGGTVISVGASVDAGVTETPHHGVEKIEGGGLVVGIAFGGPEKPRHHAGDEQSEEPGRVVETTCMGIVREVDREHDRVVLDVGSGVALSYKLSKLRDDAVDPKEFDASMQRGERLDITTTAGGHSHVTQDYGRDDEWRKGELLKSARAEPNGDLTIGNMTVKADLANGYKRWLAQPYDKADQDLINDTEKAALDKTSHLVIGENPSEPDFSRGSSSLPKLGVHMAADGKGAVRGAGLDMKGATFTGMDDKDGVTTVHYTIAGRPQAISMPDTVGGFGKNPANPYNTGSIDDAFKTGVAVQPAREAALAGAKNLVRELDAGHGPVPLELPRGTTAQDLFKRMTFDEKTYDVHIGNLTLKQDVAAYYLRTLSTEPGKDPEFIARIERLADSQQPTVVDLAKTKEFALKERDAQGFGEPPNPIKAAFSSLKENEKFDFSIDAKTDAAKLTNRTENLETTIHPDRVEDPQPVPPQQQQHSRQIVHTGP